MDVDLRKLRYFVAVARQLHFGRAAAELHIAQPVLSRQIRALEAEFGAQLFRRDRRSTELTCAGRQLLEDAPQLLAAAEALRRRVERSADDRTRFVVGFMPGITVTAVARAMCGRHPGLAVEVVRTSWADQAQVVLDGRVDVSFVRLPVDQRGLALRPLFAEPRVVALPAGHRLAGEPSVVMAELGGERLLQDPDAVPEWRDLPVPAGRRPERARPSADTVEEKLEYVAAHEGMVVLPLSVAAFYTRSDVVHVPISDIAPNRVCLAWAAGRTSPLLAEFAELATELAAGGAGAGPELSVSGAGAGPELSVAGTVGGSR
ncbi:LysR family transcriptional regulator [Kitasatospora xanthocidica]|uniref:LysR family transcriptional regulator n=1 Tax=Kitasatospora xanthocidica TaxID=83382 RepID=UPI001672D241|nr:LysR substrate-binding domain-containing protein [Kitasatospora xanthocidica]GHF61831.1 LysR family transcriptional regulator [Kitasatospora xanthocidica]